MFDRVWLVSTTEANVALGVVIAAVTIASHRARQRRDGQALPAWMTWWAIAGLLSVFPVAATGSVDAVIATNLVRLSWILAVASCCYAVRPRGASVSREPKEVIDELFRRGPAGDDTVIDELIAEDMVNHAAGPARQGREGWKQIIENVRTDLGADFSIDNHHLIADGDLVAHHMTIHGRHQASTMPLLAGVEATGADVRWTYMHLWRVVNGQVVEHWACRDDVGLLRQVGAWPPPVS